MQRILLQDMIAIYERRTVIAMKARNRLKLSEQALMERYRRLTSGI